MKHAGPGALDALGPLLEQVRALPGLTEKARGVFYRRSKAFLHFHEDPTGLYADVRLAEDFRRFRVQTDEEQAALVDLLSKDLTV